MNVTIIIINALLLMAYITIQVIKKFNSFFRESIQARKKKKIAEAIQMAELNYLFTDLVVSSLNAKDRKNAVKQIEKCLEMTENVISIYEDYEIDENDFQEIDNKIEKLKANATELRRWLWA